RIQGVGAGWMSDKLSCGVQFAVTLARAAPSCLLLLLLAACVGTVAGTAPKALQGVRTVGIVSAIGSKFELSKVGVIPFLDKKEELPIDSWGMDDLVIAKARALLSRRFDVRPVTYRRAALAPLREPESWIAWQAENRREVGSRLRAAVSSQG